MVKTNFLLRIFLVVSMVFCMAAKGMTMEWDPKGYGGSTIGPSRPPLKNLEKFGNTGYFTHNIESAFRTQGGIPIIELPKSPANSPGFKRPRGEASLRNSKYFKPNEIELLGGVENEEMEWEDTSASPMPPIVWVLNPLIDRQGKDGFFPDPEGWADMNLKS